jgi:hypothetical protein
MIILFTQPKVPEMKFGATCFSAKTSVISGLVGGFRGDARPTGDIEIIMCSLCSLAANFRVVCVFRG